MERRMKNLEERKRYKRAVVVSIFVCLLTISLYTISLFVEKVDADGGANSGFTGLAPHHSGGTGGNFPGSTLVAFGYRVSLVYDDPEDGRGTNPDGHKAGERVKGTKSVDYWQGDFTNGGNGCLAYGLKVITNNYNCFAWTVGSPKDYYRCTYSTSKKTKQELSGDLVGDGSCSKDYGSTSYGRGQENRYDTFTSTNYGYVNEQNHGGVWGDSSTAYKSGNYITVHAMNKLTEIFLRFRSETETEQDINDINNFLLDCGYNKGNGDAKTNVSTAGSEMIVLQLEPVSALARNNKIYIGTSAEQASMTHINERWNYDNGAYHWHYQSATYLAPMIYARRNEQDVADSRNYRAGIPIVDNFSYENVTPGNARSINSALAVALFYLGDFGPKCDGDLIQALTDGDETAYNGLYTKYKDTMTDEELYLVKNYSYNDAKFYFTYNEELKKSLTCAGITCAQKGKAIYNACKSNPDAACKVGNTRYDNYEKALIANSSDDPDRTKLITTSSYNNSQWNPIYIKYQRKFVSASFTPASCKNSKVTCEQGNIDKIWNGMGNNENYSNGGYSYDEYFNWLQAATNSAFLSKNVWVPIGEDGPKCDGEIPDCPGNFVNNGCGGQVYVSDAGFGLNNTTAETCWKSGFAYTDGGIVGSFIKKVTKHNDEKNYDNVCKLYCGEQVSFDLPGSPVGHDGDTIRAGTIFKWGTSNSTKDNKYGSMTITKKCAVIPEDVTYTYTDKETGKEKTETVTSDCTGMSFSYSPDEWGTVNTTFDLNYTDPIGTYSYNGTQYIVKKNPSSSTGFTNKTCTGNCSNLTQDVLTASATYDLTYETYLNWYANKTTGDPTPARTEGSTLSSLAWYKWIGYGLPTSFMTPNGTYGKSSSSDGKLSLTIDMIGTNDHFSQLLKTKTSKTSIVYSCSFKIINELFGNDCQYDTNGHLTANSPSYCDPTDNDTVDDPNSGADRNRFIRDIDVVFRIVDLVSPSNTAVSGSVVNNAFPGILGTGRVRGRNWANLSDSEIEDILTEDIYKNKPMYSLELNTANIQYIRKLNRDARSHNIDPYEEMRMYDGTNESNLAGYTGYYCVNRDSSDTYKYCASRFLSHLALADRTTEFKNHGGKSLTGSCISSSTTTNYRANIYARSTGCQRTR